MKATSFQIALTICLAILMPACGQAVPTPAPETQRPPTLQASAAPQGETPDLTGSEWNLVKISGRAASRDAPVTLAFPNPGELSGNGGCNNYFARFELAGQSFSLMEGGLQTTTGETMGCDVPESVLEQEQAYFAHLGRIASVQLEGGRLNLKDESGEAQLVFERFGPVVIDPALKDFAWSLSSLSGEPLLPDTYISLEFSEGTAGGSAGCNGYGGKLIAADRGQLLSGEIASTVMLCEREDGVDVMGQEANYLETFKKATRYHIEGGQLQFLDADGTLLLVYEGQERIPQDPSSLAGTAWELTSFDGAPPVEGSQPSLTFLDRRRVSGNAGCRDFTASYQAIQDRIRFPEIRMVQEECLEEEAFQSQEGQFTDALNWVNRYELEPDRLVLYTSRGEELVFSQSQEEGVEP